MKTQISRWSHEPGKRRSGIYQQQGRMISDADLNELMELLRRRVDDALGEVVGSGGPRANDPGLVAAGAKLRRGVLYAEGVRGRLEPSASAVIANDGTFALEAQADFPSPQPLPNTGEQTLYADLWDLSATALQDPAQLDPGLHGADTCTRTHTLVQVKWCAKTIDPLTDAKNPRQGDARLGLAIREGSSDPDPCDPCAEEVALDKRIGNYLFRVEVHDVKGDANAPSEITLKWSSENGAEQHSQDAAPSEFKRGDWIYEFYSDKTERHSGVHLNGFAPARPVLVKDGWPDTPPDKADLPYVRRWDGYCVLTGGAGHWSIKMDSGTLQAKDLGRTFVQLPNDGTKPTHGHFTLDSKLTAYLSGLVLTLALDGRSFVAGDYWLAAVREDAPDAARVLPAESGPIGVTHRYVFLAHVKDKVVQDLTDEETRRLSFPPLANVTADRIGYSTGPGGGIVEQRWQDILAEPSPLVGLPFNVQDAIDRLVTKLESSDIGYNLPGCMGNTLRGRLYDPDPAHAAQKVNDVLDKLLCGLDSTSIPYKLAAATTIQNVLDTLATDVAARVKIAGDTMTGPLVINPSPAVATPLDVHGTLFTEKFMVGAAPNDKAVLTYDAATQLAKWLDLSLTAWTLSGGNLSTDPGSVTGSVTIGTNPLRFSSAWTAFPDNSTNQAEISNDTGTYKTLMIVGNKSAGGVRRVSVWDKLEVNGTLTASDAVTFSSNLSVSGTLNGRTVGDAATLNGLSSSAFSPASHNHDSRYPWSEYSNSDWYNPAQERLLRTFVDRPKLVTFSYNLIGANDIPQADTYVNGPLSNNIEVRIKKIPGSGGTFDKDYQLWVKNNTGTRIYISVEVFG